MFPEAQKSVKFSLVKFNLTAVSWNNQNYSVENYQLISYASHSVFFVLCKTKNKITKRKDIKEYDRKSANKTIYS